MGKNEHQRPRAASDSMKAVTRAGYCAAAGGGNCTRRDPSAPTVPAEQTPSGQGALLRVTCWMLPEDSWFCCTWEEEPRAVERGCMTEFLP